MKKLLRILGWTAAIIAVLIILAAVGLKLFFPKDKVRQMAMEQAREATGRDVTIGDLDVSFWGGLGVKLHDVTISNPGGWQDSLLATVDNVDVKLSLWPLLSGEYQIDRLIINGPEATLVKRSDGEVNYDLVPASDTLPQEVERAPAEAKAAAAAISFDRLEVNDGRIAYIDDSSLSAYRLFGLSLSTHLANPRGGFYESQGTISTDSVVVRMEDTWPALAIGLKYEIDYDMNRGRLTVDESELNFGGLEFELSGQVTSSDEGLGGRISIVSQRVGAADLLRLLPPEQMAALEELGVSGDFSFEAELDYDESRDAPLYYSGTAVLSDLKMSQADVPGELELARALVDFRPGNARMTIEEAYFDQKPLKGHVVVNSFEDPSADGALAGQLDLAFIQPFLPVENEPELGGELSFDIKFSGRIADPEEMQFSGDVRIADGRYSDNSLPEPIEELTLDAYFDNDLTRINNFNARMPSAEVSFTGRVTNLVPYVLADSAVSASVAPTLDGQLQGAMNLALANGYLAEDDDTLLGGQASFDVNLVGSLTDPGSFQPRGSFSVSDVFYRDTTLPEPIEKLDAEVETTPQLLTINRCNIQFVSSDLALTGTMTNPFPYLWPDDWVDPARVERPFVTFELTSRYFNTDEMFPEAVPGADSVAIPAEPAADTLPLFVMPEIDGRGHFTLDTLIYSLVPFTSATGDVRIRNDKIHCENVTAQVYSGSITGQTTIDLSDPNRPVYSGQFDARQIQADDFVSRFSPLDGHVFGQFNMTGSYEAAGWEPEKIKQSLDMDGRIVMREGKVVTSGVVYKTLNAVADKVGESFAEEQPLNNLNTQLVVEDGKVRLDDLQTSLGELGDLELGGWYGFNGDISYDGSILLSRRWSEKLLGGGLLGDILGDSGSDRARLPVKADGTLDSPKFNIDWNALSKQTGEKLMEKGSDLLKGLFEKK